MIYGYIRVSTDKQDTDNQKIGVNEKAAKLGFAIDEWISDDGVSGTKEPEKRKLGKLLSIIQKDDVIICSELSRLGRKLFMIMRILEHCMQVGAKVYTVKDGYELGDNIQSKVLAFAFGLAAEIERNLISQRTLEGLEKRKRDGVILGRRVGSKGRKLLDGKEDEIKKYISIGLSTSSIARIYKTHRATVLNFMKEKGIAQKNEVPKQLADACVAKYDMLLPHKERLITLINSGHTVTSMALILQAEGIDVSGRHIKSFLQRYDLWDYFERTNNDIRRERNKDCGKYKIEH